MVGLASLTSWRYAQPTLHDLYSARAQLAKFGMEIYALLYKKKPLVFALGLFFLKSLSIYRSHAQRGKRSNFAVRRSCLSRRSGWYGNCRFPCTNALPK